MHGYKVVEEDDDGVYRSAWMTVLGNIYELKKKTVSKEGCGPLAAFETLENAKEFKHDFVGSRGKIFRCRIKRSKRIGLWLEDTNILMPRNTIYCDSITLLSEISERWTDGKPNERMQA